MPLNIKCSEWNYYGLVLKTKTPGALGWWEPLAWVMFFSYVDYFTNFIV